MGVYSSPSVKSSSSTPISAPSSMNSSVIWIGITPPAPAISPPSR